MQLACASGHRPDLRPSSPSSGHEYEFKIETPDGNHTGASIKNVFPGCNFRGMCSRADNLQVAFPTTASPESRAILLGAAFMLDYLFFEQDSRVCCGSSDPK